MAYGIYAAIAGAHLLMSVEHARLNATHKAHSILDFVCDDCS